MFEERKKKTLAFEIWDFLCEEYKKKYNSAIFPFINDRCCFIVVNIVFHAPWSITCLSHVLIFYIVYIWFHFCKKKKPNISLYISYYFITKQICTEALSHCQQHMFVFLSLSELFSRLMRNDLMNYCLQDLSESEIYCVWAVLFDLHDNNFELKSPFCGIQWSDCLVI